MLTYLVKFHCICVIWSGQSTDQYNVSIDVMLNYAKSQPIGINSTSIKFPNFYLIATEHNVAAAAAAAAVKSGDDVRRNFDKAVESGINFGCQVNAFSNKKVLRTNLMYSCWWYTFYLYTQSKKRDYQSFQKLYAFICI